MTEAVLKYPMGNKGEWSELYAFFKILSDGIISAGDANMKALGGKTYRIIKLGRTEKEGRREYKILSHDRFLFRSNIEERIVESENLKQSVINILQTIKNQKGKASFGVPAANTLMERFGLSTIKSGSGSKSDFEMTISEGVGGQEMDMEFSVKSSLGGAATLLNASSHTNFRFKVEKLNNTEYTTPKGNLRSNLSKMVASGVSFEFERMESEIFEKNLKRAESILPMIVSEVLLKYYTRETSSVEELVKEVESDGVFMGKYGLEKGDVEFKFKEFLLHVSLGMMPGTNWNGRQEASGGYIIVRQDGELICYRTYGLDLLKEYIYKNVKLDTPSTSRHKFGSFFQEGNKLYIDLNLQIRFKK